MSEHAEQVSVVDWWALQYKRFGVADERLLFCVPNAGKRSFKMAAWLRREGLRKGLPDLMLAVPRGPFHGMFIEMKTSTGKPTSEQLELMTLLRLQDYNVIMARGATEAIRAITAYLGGKYGVQAP